MARPGFYSDAQWQWVHDRVIEGYTVTECAKFLGLSRNYLPVKFEKLGYAVPKKQRVPLNERKGEFYALCEPGDDC